MKGDKTMVKNCAESTVPVAANAERASEREFYFSPRVDIYESEEGLTVLADVPGVTPEDLSIKVENGILSLHAKASHKDEVRDASYLWREFGHASFCRQFQLPEEVDPENIKAELKNGVLTLFLPRAESVKPRLIEVKVS